MSHEVTKMNIDNNYTSESVISANNTPLSENEKSLDKLVQQNINVKLNVAKVKGLPYTVTDKKAGTISIVKSGKIIAQKKLRGVI
jgi:hypothetical protein